MIRNNDENAFLGSSGIALLFSLILKVNELDFLLPKKRNLCFIMHSVMEFMQVYNLPINFLDIILPEL